MYVHVNTCMYMYVHVCTCTCTCMCLCLLRVITCSGKATVPIIMPESPLKIESITLLD